MKARILISLLDKVAHINYINIDAKVKAQIIVSLLNKDAHIYHINIGAKVKARIDAQALRNFLPEDTSMYFRYNGSLTTPGCFESVIWTVFDQKQTISHRQVHKSCHFKTYVNYGLAKNNSNHIESMQELLENFWAESAALTTSCETNFTLKFLKTLAMWTIPGLNILKFSIF